ncbi:MAG: ABC transporter permease [Bacteroidales bacterium]|jgi:ABC-2 type transport system permease protein|nr:ABC transporter permease [Bacteroidales bacterium]MCI2145437.1 ABC transporter permease [Bacteroidales bacterium]
MRHLETINIIIGREFSTRVKKKSFLWITLLTPVFFAACFIIPVLIMNTSKGEKGRVINVVDRSGIVAPALKNSEEMTFDMQPADSDIESLKGGLSDKEGAYALVLISPLDSAGDISVVSYSREPLSLDVRNAVSDAVKKQVEDYKLRKYDIVNLDKILSDISSDVKFNSITITKKGEKEDSVEVYMVVSYILSFMIYMFIVLFGGMVMRSVIEEKTSRVVEVIVSSVKSVDLMIGKIVGVALVALTQFLIWIVFTAVLIIGFQAIVGVDFFKTPVARPGMEQVVVSSGTDLGSNIQQQLSNPDSEMAGIVKSIKAINFPYLIGCFLLYFILGYMLYASMYAAVGSAVDNETDTQQLTIPITAPLIIGLFVMLQAFQYPDASVAVWCSIIPWTSPMVMLARLPFGNVPAWQLTLSLVLLFLTFIGTAWISGKIYRVGILSYGKKATWKDMFKWMKYKN